jgi:hypothetical protein
MRGIILSINLNKRSKLSFQSLAVIFRPLFVQKLNRLYTEINSNILPMFQVILTTKERKKVDNPFESIVYSLHKEVSLGVNLR